MMFTLCVTQPDVDFLENVLYVLLQGFKFSTTDKKIYWNWNNVVYPSMDRENVEPSLILRVEAIVPASH